MKNFIKFLPLIIIPCAVLAQITVLAPDGAQEATGEDPQSSFWHLGSGVVIEDGNLRWSDTGNNRVTLAWDAAAEDDPSDFYDVYCDGDWIGEVPRDPGTGTYSFSDYGISGNATVTYQIHARGTFFESVSVRTLTIDMQSPPSSWEDIELSMHNGNNQKARPGMFLENPITIQLTGDDSAGYPVTFTIDQGGGSLHVDKNSPGSTEITLISDAEGKVQLWYRQPSQDQRQSRISASSAGQEVFFHAMSDSTYAPGTGGGTPGDNLPDGFAAWALEHGLDPTRPNDDTDGDGVSNLNEFRMGTNPKDAASVYRLVLERTNTRGHTLSLFRRPKKYPNTA